MKRELRDPDLTLIRNLRSLPLDVLVSFNPDIGAFKPGHDVDDLDENYDEDAIKSSKKYEKSMHLILISIRSGNTTIQRISLSF